MGKVQQKGNYQNEGTMPGLNTIDLIYGCGDKREERGGGGRGGIGMCEEEWGWW